MSRRREYHGFDKGVGFQMTYSIIALDPHRRMLGVATASGSIAVGSRVPWAMHSVGAVATQAYTNPALGPLILSYLKRGFNAKEALQRALSEDLEPSMRQVAVITADGDKVVHNGSNIPNEKGYYIGDRCVSIANLVVSKRIPTEMCLVFEEIYRERGFIEALITALEKAHELGGDLRGDHSASIIVVGETIYGEYYDKIIDIRVDYSLNPISDLRKIYSYLNKE